MIMPTSQEQFDDAMFDFSMEDYDSAIAKLEALLADSPDHFDARLALGMAHCRKGDFATAIREGHKAEKLRPQEQLVHTNLSLFYMKSGDKKTAEHHGLQARLASWRNPDQPSDEDSELTLTKPSPPPVKISGKLPAMPWKNKKPIDSSTASPTAEKPNAGAGDNHSADSKSKS